MRSVSRVLHLLVPRPLDESTKARSDIERSAWLDSNYEYIEELKRLSANLDFIPEVHLLTLDNSKQEIDAIPLNELVFNLCDGCDLDGVPGPSVAAAVENRGFSSVVGCDLAFINNTLTKAGMKKMFKESNVASPPGFHATVETDLEAAVKSNEMDFPLFVKVSDSYGSVGLDERSVCHTFEDLRSKTLQLFADFPNLIVEEFIEGQEFSVLISGNSRDDSQPIVVYPPAERAFSKNLDKYKRFITFVSNWNTELQLHQYAKVENEEDFQALQDLARRAYIATSGNCFGRVDIRKRESTGRFYVLEVNASCGIGSGSSSDFILQLANQTTPDFFKILLSKFLPVASEVTEDAATCSSPEALSPDEADQLPALPPHVEHEVKELLRHPSISLMPTDIDAPLNILDST